MINMGQPYMNTDSGIAFVHDKLRITLKLSTQIYGFKHSYVIPNTQGYIW
jgi:hypothetical protein